MERRVPVSFLSIELYAFAGHIDLPYVSLVCKDTLTHDYENLSYDHDVRRNYDVR